MAQQDPKNRGQAALDTETGRQDVNSPDVECPDADLVKKTLEDPESFALIIEKYEQRLMRYLRYFTGNDRQLAEDIFQEAMIKVYRNLNGYNPKMPFAGWIYRIVRNEALNQLKKKKLQNAVSLDGDDDESVSLLQVLDSGENLVDDLARKEVVGKVREAMQHLRADYREILMLRYIEDYDYNEISYVLQKPLGTVGVMIGRAKEAFRELANKFGLLKYE